MIFFDKEKYKDLIQYINEKMSKSSFDGFTATIEDLTKIKYDMNIKDIAEVCNYLEISFEYNSWQQKIIFRKNFKWIRR